MIELRDYQEKAKNKLTEKIDELLGSNQNEVCVFKAPTGSGKTLMVSETLKKLVKERVNKPPLSFIWISVRMLHEQSKEKLEQYYEDDKLLQCSYFEDLIDRKIDENEILFINWHSINKKDINLYIKDNEQDNNLNKIIENTKEEGRQIILIIDESHHTAKSEKSRELIDLIGPKVTLEVSATPHSNTDERVIVKLDDVKKEEMIKSEIQINPDFKDIKIDIKSTDELVIDQALKKRKELIEKYTKERSNINPLVLIQLPDRSGIVDNKDKIISILKDKFNITEENGKLAIWLSEEKTSTLINIDKPDNEVEVLVFKQAIALGWDCPRASILVIFREYASFEFTIQTIGRIMRMPELKYYADDDLNKGYIFTNLANITIAEDYAKDYITINESKRKNSLYSVILLKSIHLKRQRERTRLSGEFTQIFSEVAKEQDLKKKITTKPSKISNSLMSDGKIQNVDKPGEVQADSITINLTEAELNVKFDRFISEMCSPFAPADSSGRIKTAIYSFFKKEYKLDLYDPQVQRIVLGAENILFIRDLINLSKERYNSEVIQKLNEQREVETNNIWEVPSNILYTKTYNSKEYPKSILSPFYFNKLSIPEEKFIDALNKSNKVKWWYKNGEREPKYFAVAYKLNNLIEPFYVDFIIQFNDGKLGLFDTKLGNTAKEAVEKSDGLQKYIGDENKKGKKLIGGIITSNDNYQTWKYYDKEKYHYDEHNLSDWKLLEI